MDILDNNIAYVATFGAEETLFWKYLPAVEQIIRSIQINKPAAITEGILQ